MQLMIHWYEVSYIRLDTFNECTDWFSFYFPSSLFSPLSLSSLSLVCLCSLSLLLCLSLLSLFFVQSFFPVSLHLDLLLLQHFYFPLSFSFSSFFRRKGSKFNIVLILHSVLSLSPSLSLSLSSFLSCVLSLFIVSGSITEKSEYTQHHLDAWHSCAIVYVFEAAER